MSIIGWLWNQKLTFIMRSYPGWEFKYCDYGYLCDFPKKVGELEVYNEENISKCKVCREKISELLKITKINAISSVRKVQK